MAATVVALAVATPAAVAGVWLVSRRQRELLESERRTRNALERTADELSHVALHDGLTSTR